MKGRALSVILPSAIMCAAYIVLELTLPAFAGRTAVIAAALLLCGAICAVVARRSERGDKAEPSEPPSEGSDEREELERIKNDFVTNVSHELRTPVTSIKGFAQTLMEPGMDENTRLRFLHIIDAETDRLKRLVDDILTLGDIQNSQAVHDRTNLSDCALHVYDMIKDTAVKKGLNISLYADPDLYVPATRSHIEQLIINLVDNAVKYTEKGCVDIRVARAGQYVELSVTDTGIGIPEDDQGRIYERFYRVDRARSREKGGTGLGLAIVKHIALLYDAALNLESSPGEGSRFTVLFRSPPAA